MGKEGSCFKVAISPLRTGIHLFAAKECFPNIACSYLFGLPNLWNSQIWSLLRRSPRLFTPIFGSLLRKLRGKFGRVMAGCGLVASAVGNNTMQDSPLFYVTMSFDFGRISRLLRRSL
ncbi:hypothetical protein U1Q18_018664 [Sarracenia purpurea var. burkii]